MDSGECLIDFRGLHIHEKAILLSVTAYQASNSAPAPFSPKAFKVYLEHEIFTPIAYRWLLADASSFFFTYLKIFFH